MQPNTKHTTSKFSTKTILLSGLLVGTLDIASAFADYYIATGKNPLFILSYIASGAFGKAALTGGTGMMLTGLVFHYTIAFSFTIVFFWLCSTTHILSRNWFVRGFAYGIFIWLIMNLVVVQLSSAPHAPVSTMKLDKVIKSALILICMIGLPLSFIAYRYAPDTFVERNDNNL